MAANRIALDAGWDRETLAAELGELAVLLPEQNLDVSFTGFDIAEIDLLVADHCETPLHPEEEELPPAGAQVARLAAYRS